MSILKMMVASQKAFAAINGEIATAPYRNFTSPKELIDFWIKKLVGNTGFGIPNIQSGIKASGSALDLAFTGTKRGVGLKVKISIPRDDAIGVIDATFYPQGPSGSYSYAMQFDPKEHISTYYLLAAYSSNNEVFPVDCIDPQLSFADTKIPDGSNVSVTLLDLGYNEMVEYLKS